MNESSCSLAKRLDCSRACSEVMAAVLMAAAVLCVCVCVWGGGGGGGVCLNKQILQYRACTLTKNCSPINHPPSTLPHTVWDNDISYHGTGELVKLVLRVHGRGSLHQQSDKQCDETAQSVREMVSFRQKAKIQTIHVYKCLKLLYYT